MQEEKKEEQEVKIDSNSEAFFKQIEEELKKSNLTIANAVRDIIAFNYSQEAADKIMALKIFNNINNLEIGEQIYLLNKFIKISILTAYSYSKIEPLQNATFLVGNIPLKGSVMDWFKFFAYRVIPYFKTYGVLKVYGI